MPFVIVLIITSNDSVKKHFLVGKSRFFVDNSVQKVWITLTMPVNTAFLSCVYADLSEKILPHCDNIACTHCNKQITSFTVFL